MSVLAHKFLSQFQSYKMFLDIILLTKQRNLRDED
jgi:hypothetical protein